MDEDLVRVGALKVHLGTAKTWIKNYFDEDRNRESKEPYAFPAYEDFDTGSAPETLNDGDLLAPALLNVRPSLAAFYGLQSVRGELEEGLVATSESVTLQSAVEDGTLRQRLLPFISFLDSNHRHGVGLTTVTKILHRKRPEFMPLHDKFVKRCYYGTAPGHPVQPSRSRSTVDYWASMCTAINEDLVRQPEVWARFSEIPRRQTVSPLRLLDVVAWKAGRSAAQYK